MGQEGANVQAVRRDKVQARIRKLKPGNTSTVASLQTANGDIISDPKEIALELKRCWGDVFSYKHCDSVLLNAWLQEELGDAKPFGDTDTHIWRLSRKGMAKVVKRSG